MQGPVKIRTSKTLREAAKFAHNDDRPCKIRKTSSSVTNFPDDCLNLIFKCIETKEDRNSFGLTCNEWLRIQNSNHESLWCDNYYHPGPENKYNPPGKYPKISPENLAILTARLLIRFQQVKYLSLSRLPKITTNFDKLKSQSFGSNVQNLYLDNCDDHSPDCTDIQLSLIFSWFPSLTYISLDSSDNITNKGLEVLAKCCSSLKTVNLPWCCSITDLGISVLLRNCRELSSLAIDHCSNITGIGFLGCAQALTCLEARGCNLRPEGFRAIVSCGALEYLYLMPSIYYELAEDEKGCDIGTETVMTISEGCPLLKELSLSNCEEVELDGWKDIGLNCKELEVLFVMGCQKLCDMGLQAVCDGCNNLSELSIDREKNSCRRPALEFFMSKKPGVVYLLT